MQYEALPNESGGIFLNIGRQDGAYGTVGPDQISCDAGLNSRKKHGSGQ